MIEKIKHWILYRFLYSKVKPELIGIQCENGGLIKGSSKSNMTHISNLANVKIGENVFIGHFNYIDGFRNVEIGRNCQITNYVSILTHSSHHSIRFESKLKGNSDANKVLDSGDVKIGEFTYVGPHTVIMPGVSIGKGCIIGAYSYISKDIPDFSVVRGLPAKVVGDTRDIDEEKILEHKLDRTNYYL